jgi:hypothetical protein
MNAEKKEEKPGDAPDERYGSAAILANMPQEVMDEVTALIQSAIEKAAPYTELLSPRDRQRKRGIGSKKLGFAKNALAHAEQSPQFLPQQLTIEKFRQDDANFDKSRAFINFSKQLVQLAVNFNLQSSDAFYKDALWYYDAVCDAFEKREDGAETAHADLAPFFKSMGARQRAQTKKEQMRDTTALIGGKRDGKMTIINVSPKMTRGKRKGIIEDFTTNNTNSTNEHE